MTAFRLGLHRDHRPDFEPEPGDVLLNSDTGNRWRVLTARPVNTRTIDPEFPRVFSLQVQRMDRAELTGDGCRVLPFVRDR